ncbi:MAG: hypothetical protein AAGF74_12040 [Pseudomonadota bacterium]
MDEKKDTPKTEAPAPEQTKKDPAPEKSREEETHRIRDWASI